MNSGAQISNRILIEAWVWEILLMAPCPYNILSGEMPYLFWLESKIWKNIFQNKQFSLQQLWLKERVALAVNFQ